MSTKNVSRRDVLKLGAAAATVAAAAGFPGVLGGLGRALAADDEPKAILDIAATAETFACTHYYRALQELKFDPTTEAYMKAGLEAEFIHLQFLNTNGGKALTEEFYFPEGTFKDNAMLGTVTSVAETVFVAAYLAATRRFAELNQPLLAMVSAQVAAVEAQHLLFMRGLAGEKPANNIALGEALFFNVSDAVPVISGLLDGKSKVAGLDLEKTGVKYPGAEAITKMVGTSMLKAVLPATDAGAFKK
jgi:hypothetical protein